MALASVVGFGGIAVGARAFGGLAVGGWTTAGLGVPIGGWGVLVLIVVVAMLLQAVDWGARRGMRAVQEGEQGSVKEKRVRRGLVSTVMVVAMVLLLKAVVIAPYRAATAGFRPVVSEGSLLLVYKLATWYEEGDMVVVRQGEQMRVARVAGGWESDGRAMYLSVERSDGTRGSIRLEDVVGKVVMNTDGA
jgi:hypothetical protein